MEGQEKRRSRRVKLSHQVWVRPSDPKDEHFDEIPKTVNQSREGIYFTTRRDSYYKGMRLFLTLPYSATSHSMSNEYIGQVVRIESLGEGRYGIAVHLLMSVNLTPSATSSTVQRK
jgi:hypothetical protein